MGLAFEVKSVVATAPQEDEVFAWKRSKSGIPFRSTDRDVATDTSRAELILSAIEKVTKAAEAEKGGLQRRLADVLAQSAVTFGAASDEYLTRDNAKDKNQKAFGEEIRHAEARLKRLEETIECYRSFRIFVVSALRSTWTGTDIRPN